MKELRTMLVNTSPSTDVGDLIIEGYPIIFNQETVITDFNGEYKEIIKREALEDTDLSDTRLLYNHDTNRVPLARSPKTMSLTIDEVGLKVRATLPNTEHGKSVYTAVQRGDLSGMSFGFKISEDGSQYDVKTNTRTIVGIKKVYEFSIVPFPAYPQTSVEAREQMSLEKIKLKKIEMAQININKILSK